MSNKKINSLTGMRFVAIVTIVITHLDFLHKHFFIINYWKYVHVNISVDFFFMLSGFGLMLSDINRKGFTVYNKVNLKNLITFGINHVKKIYPLYISTILIGIPLYLYQAYNSGKSVLTIIKFCILKLYSSFLLIQSASGMLKISHQFNGVCWFLSCLFCIYLVSPIYINIVKRFSINLKRIMFLLISLPILSSIMAFIFSQIEKVSFFDDLVYGSPYMRIIYVVYGMVIAVFFSKYKNLLKIKNANLYEIVLSIIFVLWIIFRQSIKVSLPFISLIYVIDMFIAGSIVFFLAYDKGVVSKLLSTPKMVYLGELSMYIFLIHFPIIIYLNEICKSFHFTEQYVAIALILFIFTSTYYISKYLYLRKSES